MLCNLCSKCFPEFVKRWPALHTQQPAFWLHKVTFKIRAWAEEAMGTRPHETNTEARAGSGNGLEEEVLGVLGRHLCGLSVCLLGCLAGWLVGCCVSWNPWEFLYSNPTLPLRVQTVHGSEWSWSCRRLRPASSTSPMVSGLQALEHWQTVTK